MSDDDLEAAALPQTEQLSAVLEGINDLHRSQREQTDLLNKLQQTVLTSRSMINELILANNELKREVQAFRRIPHEGDYGKKVSLCSVVSFFYDLEALKHTTAPLPLNFLLFFLLSFGIARTSLGNH